MKRILVAFILVCILLIVLDKACRALAPTAAVGAAFPAKHEGDECQVRR